MSRSSSFHRSRYLVIAVASVLIGIAATAGRGTPAGPQSTSSTAGAATDVFESEKLIDVSALREAFTGGPRARVIVNLTAPPGVASFRAWTSAESLAEHQVRVAELQGDLLADFTEEELLPALRFENQPGFSADVTLGGLERLVADPRVESVELVRELELHTRQGLQVIDPTGLRFELPGQGVAIAVCDSGVDYDHPALGGDGNGSPDGDFPNEKVIGGFNFDTGDGNPLDINGHGTAVCGISAGFQADPGADFEFESGVATEAKIYAIKVSLGDGLVTTTDRVIAAWNWVVTHKNDDPDHPILVVCMSLGSGRFTDFCDETYPSMASAAHAVVECGITIFASSGNDGYCDAISLPACLSDTVAVGGVYDERGLQLDAVCIRATSCTGGPLPQICTTAWACQDLNTSPDIVACYSNSGPRLDLLAPAEQADAPGLGAGYQNFGGTSAAAPYAAGAAASIQAGAIVMLGEPLSPSALRSHMKMTGISVFDAKSDFTTPRVSLDQAIPALSELTPCQGQEGDLVLQVNDQTGVLNGGKVEVLETGPIVLSIRRPSPGGTGQYVVHMNAGAPSADSYAVLPRGLGIACFDLLLPRGAEPVAVFNNFGKESQIGASSYFGIAIGNPPFAPIDGPAVFFERSAGDPQNLPLGSEWTLQGVISNDSVPGPRSRQASVTNAALMVVTQ